MNNEKVLNWLEPTPPKRGGYRPRFPILKISYKAPQKKGDKVSSPYYRVAANKAFIEKYYPETSGLKKAKKIAFAQGGHGILFTVKPKRGMPVFQFNKSNVISDQGLVEVLYRQFGVDLSGKEFHTMRLYTKPHGTHEGMTLIKLMDEEP
jgi:hypothetical protein